MLVLSDLRFETLRFSTETENQLFGGAFAECGGNNHHEKQQALDLHSDEEMQQNVQRWMQKTEAASNGKNLQL